MYKIKYLDLDGSINYVELNNIEDYYETLDGILKEGSEILSTNEGDNAHE